MKKIAIIGVGYVGLTTALIFANAGYKVICIDKDKNKINSLKNKKMPFYEKKCDDLLVKSYDNLVFKDSYEDIKYIDLIFVCVGTPLQTSDNTLDTSTIVEVCKAIKGNTKLNKDITICIRSTILPGTCKKVEDIISNSHIHIAHNPEFLSQGSAINDSINATRVVIGSNNVSPTKKLCSIYNTLLKKNKKNIPLLVMKREEAEMVKFMANSYLAMRISFVNEMSNLCEELNINVSEVINGVKYDNRIGGHYLKCGIGYGGSCLPKDTKAIAKFSDKVNSPLNLIKATIEVNEFQLKKCFDRIKKDFSNLLNVNVAILGVTFKAGTDDIRNACSLYTTDRLLENKSFINVYDPKGLSAFKNIYENNVNYYNSISECIDKCNIIIIATEWDEIINYNFNEINLSKKVHIYDFKSCLNRKEIINSNIKYWTVGGSHE